MSSHRSRKLNSRSKRKKLELQERYKDMKKENIHDLDIEMNESLQPATLQIILINQNY